MLHIIGYANGNGGRDTQSCMGPLVIQSHLDDKEPHNIEWVENIYARTPLTKLEALEDITDCNERLALMVSSLAKVDSKLCVLSGDHSSAMGTWSGFSKAQNNEIGLIWIDAHLDSHTPETSPSKNIHGMPLASLLGYGDPFMCNISHKGRKVNPKHLCLIGSRSYEDEEIDLLRSVGATIIHMDRVQKEGFNETFQEALSIAKNPSGYGMSIDLDAFDPLFIPGVSCREKNGIHPDEFLKAFNSKDFKDCLGFEITEFNPYMDQNKLTLNFIDHLINEISMWATKT